MGQEFLTIEDCNVIVVDWHGGSSPPYTQAVANTRLIGRLNTVAFPKSFSVDAITY